MTSAIFRYAIRHIFMADFLLSAMNRHPPLTTLIAVGSEEIGIFCWEGSLSRCSCVYSS